MHGIKLYYIFKSFTKILGFNQWTTARIFRKLMLRLGHNKFLLQGGDWGSLVCTIFAHYYPQKYVDYFSYVLLLSLIKVRLI